MPTFQNSLSSHFDIDAKLQRIHDAGIDPAFDSDMEDLERQFQELRFAAANESWSRL